MPREINPALSEAFREIGRPTTLHDLARQGVRRVRSFGLAEISLLIERAVNRTLLERTIGGLDPEEKKGLVEDAAAEFGRQLDQLEDLADSRQLLDRHRREMQAQLADLRARLSPGGGQAATAPDRAGRAERLERLRVRVQARLLPLFDHVPTGGPTVKGTAREIVALFAEELEAALAEQRAQLEGQIGLLERRVAKLVASMEATEKVLARVSSMKDLEVGLESIYRSVQGLSPDTIDFERKQALMQRIFEANLALRGERVSPALPSQSKGERT